MLFEYVIVTKLSKKDKDENKLEDILAGPLCIAAHDDEAAQLKAATKMEGFDADTMEVITRPFEDD